MWNDENDILFNVLELLNDSETKFPIKCPNCNFDDCHIYIHDNGESVGSLWIWCSQCKNYIHATYIIPKWWKNCPAVDINRLQTEPDYLESIKESIDDWINNLIK